MLKAPNMGRKAMYEENSEEVSIENETTYMERIEKRGQKIEQDPEIRFQNALFVMREDLGRQLGLASDRQNTMLQSIGIIVAFSSILFLQLLAMDPAFDGYGLLFIISIGSVLSCSVFGIHTIMVSSNFALSAGMEADKMVELYDNHEIDNYELKVANGISRALISASQKNASLTERVTYMVAALLLGVFTMFAGWCL
jgi:hypothetical protein